jgi:hypothetical protein
MAARGTDLLIVGHARPPPGRLAEQQVVVVDAPVSGGVARAAGGDPWSRPAARQSVGSSTRVFVHAPAANSTRTGWPQPARMRQTESRVSSSTSCQSWRAPGWNTYSSGAS